MTTDDVAISDSKIQGKGVFAARNFKKGEIVLRWDTSHLIPADKVTQLSDKDKKYISFFNNKYVVMQEPEKYVNHSCDANTTAVNFCDVATRDINKGEEITGNYSEELLPGTEMTCNCGSINCRRIIKS